MAHEVSALDGKIDIESYCYRLAKDLEIEIERLGVALDIDWSDELAVRALAREALEHSQEALAQYAHDHSDYRQKAKVELFGVAALMMKLMRDSAVAGIHTHGGEAWKAFSRALMKEDGLMLG